MDNIGQEKLFAQPPLQHSTNDDDRQDLDNIFNQRVNDETQFCPKKFVLLYLLTKDVNFLRLCGKGINADRDMSETVDTDRKEPANEQDRTPSRVDSPLVTDETEKRPQIATYSGNILKRILDNIDAGTAKVDFIDDVKAESQKRGRLSINGALSSLVDLLRHESRRHSRPTYAFHRDMLNLG